MKSGKKKCPPFSPKNNKQKQTKKYLTTEKKKKMSSSSLSISLNDLEVIIECAQKHFWMQPLSVGEKLDLKRNLQNYLENMNAIFQAQNNNNHDHVVTLHNTDDPDAMTFPLKFP